MTVPSTVTSTPGPPCEPAEHAGRWELLRALGAIASSPPPLCAPAAAGLDLPAPSAAEHTAVFVLSAPPHAAIHLGADGKLGGEGLDRVAGFWRALGLSPPPDADHLGALLALCAHLGEAQAAAGERARAGLRLAREALLWEHLWSWAPGYLTAVARLEAPSLGPWARLTLRALAREARLASPPAALPLALRDAPAGPGTAADGAPGGPPHGGGLLDALLTPVRSGLVITSEDLRRAAVRIGAGCRPGERRFTLQAMLDQDGPATLGWLARFARIRAREHAGQQPVAGPDPRRWWAARAGATAAWLRELQGGLVIGGYSGT